MTMIAPVSIYVDMPLRWRNLLGNVNEKAQEAWEISERRRKPPVPILCHVNKHLGSFPLR